MLQLERDGLGFLLAVQRRYGRLATVRYGQTPVVVLFDPELIRYVLSERPQKFSNGGVVGGLVYGKLLGLWLMTEASAPRAADRLRDLVGDDGLITGDGDQHDHLRHLILPAFSRRSLALSAETITGYAEDLVGSWRAGEVIDVVNEMRRLTMRVIVTVLFGSELTSEFPHGIEAIMATLRNPSNLLQGLLRELPIDLPFTPHGRRKRAMREADGALYALIDSRIAGGAASADVLSLLLAGEDGDGPPMSRQHVRDAIVSLIAAGHETTTNTLAWTLYLLSLHPQVFAQVRRELAEVLAGRSPALDDLPRLEYLNQVIKESMRLYPAGWVQGRTALEDFWLDGYHIPKGTLLMVTQWVTHRHPGLWADAESFRPERWDPASPAKPPTGAYFPFGAGRRICPGKSLSELEVLLVLPVFLQRFYPLVLPGQTVEPVPLLTLRPNGRILVRLEPSAGPGPTTAVGQSEASALASCPVPTSTR
jgi:cytochrome P450